MAGPPGLTGLQGRHPATVRQGENGKKRRLKQAFLPARVRCGEWGRNNPRGFVQRFLSLSADGRLGPHILLGRSPAGGVLRIVFRAAGIDAVRACVPVACARHAFGQLFSTLRRVRLVPFGGTDLFSGFTELAPSQQHRQRQRARNIGNSIGDRYIRSQIILRSNDHNAKEKRNRFPPPLRHCRQSQV